jgi:starch synthase
MRDALKISILSAEFAPFVKVGGLGEVIGDLSRALARLGHKVSVFLPRYRTIDPELLGEFVAVHEIKVPIGRQGVTGQVWRGRMPGEEVEVFLLDRPELYDRDGIYTDPVSGDEYPDNPQRFIFYSRGVIETMRALKLTPDVLHASDYQTGFAPAYLKTIYSEDSVIKRVASLFSIHNLGYQGIYDPEVLSLAGFPPDLFYPMSPFEFWGKINFMKTGILFSDLLSTVSERYAQEIQWTEEFGFGLEGVLRQRQRDLIGILNGIDVGFWDPAHDPHIPHHYSAADLAPKTLNKAELIKQMGLGEERTRRPLVGLISRLVDQKGLDLLAAVAPLLVERDLTLVMLGTGQKKHEEFFQDLARRFPDRVAVRIAFDEPLAHLIEAGSDLFLMPSRYEPCGLNQMYSLRYGTLPVVRATGGLADTVVEYDPASGKGNGFVFTGYSAEEFLAAIERALLILAQPEAHRRAMQNGMEGDYSWERTAERYVEAYREAIERKKRVNLGSWAHKKVEQH